MEMMNQKESDHLMIKIQTLLHHLLVAQAIHKGPLCVVSDLICCTSHHVD